VTYSSDGIHTLPLRLYQPAADEPQSDPSPRGVTGHLPDALRRDRLTSNETVERVPQLYPTASGPMARVELARS
jgi:hypothetical protein